MIDIDEIQNQHNHDLAVLAINLINGTSVSSPVEYRVDFENDEAFFLNDEDVYHQIRKITNGKFSNLVFNEYRNDFDEVVKTTIMNTHFEKEVMSCC